MGVGCFDSRSPEAEWRSIFLVQEYIDGGTLRSIILRQGLQPRKKHYTYCDALSWSIDIAEALAFMHSQCPMVIHRDVKVDNIFISTTYGDGKHAVERGRSIAKVGDLGLATLVLMQQRKPFLNRKGTDMTISSIDDNTLQEGNCKLRSDGTSHPKQSVKENNTKSMNEFLSYQDFNDGLTGSNAFKLTGNTGSYIYMCVFV